MLASGQRIGAGEVRRLCCDADLVPVVLGSRSEVLDVGRVNRLVTRGVRIALTHRDGGCVFPACDTHPTACEAHHVVPWWAGGPTCLSNLVLLCHHHHGLVEPDPFGVRDQWAVRVGSDGVPECLPPRRLDPERAALRHQRFEGVNGPGHGGAPPPHPLSRPFPRTPSQYPPAQPRQGIPAEHETGAAGPGEPAWPGSGGSERSEGCVPAEGRPPGEGRVQGDESRVHADGKASPQLPTVHDGGAGGSPWSVPGG